MVCATLLAKHWVRHSLHMGGVAVTVSLLMGWLQGVQRRLKKLREQELVLPPDGVFLGWGAPCLSLTRQHQTFNVLATVALPNFVPNL